MLAKRSSECMNGLSPWLHETRRRLWCHGLHLCRLRRCSVAIWLKCRNEAAPLEDVDGSRRQGITRERWTELICECWITGEIRRPLLWLTWRRKDDERCVEKKRNEEESRHRRYLPGLFIAFKFCGDLWGTMLRSAQLVVIINSEDIRAMGYGCILG